MSYIINAYESMTKPESIRVIKRTDEHVVQKNKVPDSEYKCWPDTEHVLEINGKPVYSENVYMCGTVVTSPVTLNTPKELSKIEDALRIVLDNEYFPITIKNFEYNGFSGQIKKGYADYTGKFKEWTIDPGVAKVECSDGKERLIPTFAMPNWISLFLPPQIKGEGTVLFGQASKS